MSIPVVKWIPGAPDELKVGMVLRSGAEVNLIGTADVGSEFSMSIEMRSGNQIEDHGQLVGAYVLEWLGNDGIVKGVSR